MPGSRRANDATALRSSIRGAQVPPEEEQGGASHDAAQRRFGTSGPSSSPAGLTSPWPAVTENGSAAARVRRTGAPERAASTPVFGTAAPGTPAPGVQVRNGPGQDNRQDDVQQAVPAPRTARRGKAAPGATDGQAMHAGQRTGKVAANGSAGQTPPGAQTASLGADAATAQAPQNPQAGQPAPDQSLLEDQQGRHRRPAERQASYREVFAIGEFRALWSAQVLSFAGDQFAQVAIAILVYKRTGSAFLTALAYALTYLPPIIGGPLLSGLADLFPRRRIMIGCDLIRATLVAGMATPKVPFAVLCILLFGTVLLGPPFSSARSALMPSVLPGDKYTVGAAIGNITQQSSQILGFVAGAAVVAIVDPSRTLALDSLSFVLSALIVATWVKRRPAPDRGQSDRPSLWAMTRDGAVLVFGSPLLRSLMLFGWLAGFYIVPEGLAAPYVHALHGSTLDVGLLMAAMPVGTVIGAFTFSRLVSPSTRIRQMGWMAMLSCAPLIGSAAHPPLWAVLTLWVLSGFGGSYQLAAVVAFVQSVPDFGRARAFGLAQSGLLAAQGIGILAGGAAAQAIGPQLVVALSGLLGLTAATLLAMGWTHRRSAMIASMRARQEE